MYSTYKTDSGLSAITRVRRESVTRSADAESGHGQKMNYNDEAEKYYTYSSTHFYAHLLDSHYS